MLPQELQKIEQSGGARQDSFPPRFQQAHQSCVTPRRKITG
jgi:hypothetical protein